jgi:Icc-related predicted phosphoesterase
MKIQIQSDLHLEWQKFSPTFQNAGADVLVLAGDICVVNHLYRNPIGLKPNIIQKDLRAYNAKIYREFFNYVNSNWKYVLYVLGNHEFYEGDWNKTENIIREELSVYSNIHILEQTKLVIDNIVFLGTSLWTDMNGEDPLTMMHCKNAMNDYKEISNCSQNVWKRLTPIDTVKKYHESLAWLKCMLQEDKSKTVVISHHAASRQSLHEKYKNDWTTNGAFINNLDNFIIDNPHIALWINGHIHNNFNYFIESTRIISNPHGYPNENSDFIPNLVIDL